MRTSGARFHEHLSVRLRNMGFTPSKADFDMWIKRLEDGTYDYIARYVDDVMVFSKDPMKYMEMLKDFYTMKGVGKPEYYLGGDVEQLEEPWISKNINTTLSAKTYISQCLPKLAKMCNKEQFHKSTTPFDPNYFAELDESPFIDAEGISKYRSLIGCANWVVTLGTNAPA